MVNLVLTVLLILLNLSFRVLMLSLRASMLHSVVILQTSVLVLTRRIQLKIVSKRKLVCTSSSKILLMLQRNIKLKRKNIGVLITDHNVHETLSITDRAYLLFDGQVLMSGTPDVLAADPHVREVYLGQNFILHKKEM